MPRLRKLPLRAVFVATITSRFPAIADAIDEAIKASQWQYRTGQLETLGMLQHFNVVTIVAPMGLGKSTISIVLSRAAAMRGQFVAYAVPLNALMASIKHKYESEGFDVVCGVRDDAAIERVRRRAASVSNANGDNSGAAAVKPLLFLISYDSFAGDVVPQILVTAALNGALGALILDETTTAVFGLLYRIALWGFSRTMRRIAGVGNAAARIAASSSSSVASLSTPTSLVEV